MASSWNKSFDCSNPEIIFQDCIAYQDKDGTIKEYCKKCPLCKEYSKNFYCADCVNNGNYVLSRKKYYELPYKESISKLARFADKIPKKYKLEKEKSVILKSFEVALARKKEIEDVKLNIRLSREKINILKQNIKVFRHEIFKGEQKIDRLVTEKKKSIELQQAFIQNTKELRNLHKRKSADICIKESNINSKQCALQRYIKDYIEELVTVIFPITKAPPQHPNEEDQYGELEDAQKTTYVQGQWVIAASPQDDIQYQIVAPCISCTGDYSAYPSWCTEYASIKENEKYVEGIPKHLLSDKNKRMFDKAYGISSALTYIAQLVNLLAFSMDIHLPKRSSITDFSRDEFVKRFHHNVAKLNANIINLCLSGNIDVSKLSPHRTVSNLLLFLDSIKNGNSGSIRYVSLEDEEELLESLEDSIFKDLPICDDSDSDNVGADFVHLSDDDISDVPEADPEPVSSLSSLVHLSDDDDAFEILEAEPVSLVEADPQNADEGSLQQNPPESLISSVMSFWKGGFGLR